MIPPNWKAECAKLVRTIDPSMATVPIYLFGGAEVAVDELFPNNRRGCRAITSPVLSFELRDLLEARGEWKGPGFSAVFKLDHFHDLIDLFPVVLHEFAHEVPASRGVARITSRMTDDAIRECFSTPSPVILPDRASYPWEKHAMDFARLACHLAWRAFRAGFDIEPEQIYHGHFYGLTSALQCFCLLDDTGELTRLANLPLSKVAKIDPPERFKRFAAKCLVEAIANQRRLVAKNAHDAGATVSTHGAEGATP